MPKPISRESVIAAFKPAIPLIDEVIADAQRKATPELMRAAIPSVWRESHIRRLVGTVRWILMADGFVDRAERFPEGFGVLSTEAQHNGGQYVFSCPGGVFTIKRQPHEGDEGQYLQQQLDLVLEEAALAEGIDPNVGIKVYLSVPWKKAPRLIIEHPTLTDPMSISLSEIRAHVPTSALPHQPRKRPVVRSTRRPKTETPSVNTER